MRQEKRLAKEFLGQRSFRKNGANYSSAMDGQTSNDNFMLVIAVHSFTVHHQSFSPSHRLDLHPMNRIQFFVLTGLSSLLVLLLIGHIFLVRQTNQEQASFTQAQQAIAQGQGSKGMMEQLAKLVYTQSKTDPDLVDLMRRNQIVYNPPADTNSTSSPTPPDPGSSSNR
jgi:hypothetical protein